jgi:hypothetical protein
MRWQSAATLASTLALAGCTDAAGPIGEQEVQVTVRVVNGTSSSSVGLVASPRAGLATTVNIESAVFVLGSLKLETAGLDNTVDWVFDESVVVPLDLAGTPTLAFDTDVPPGVYKELEVSVDKLEVGNPAEGPLITDWPDLADASVLVTGTVTVDGGTPEAFTFTAALDIDLELLFDAPITFTAGNDGLTLVSLVIDPSEWFHGVEGVLDATDPANHCDRGQHPSVHRVAV